MNIWNTSHSSIFLSWGANTGYLLSLFFKKLPKSSILKSLTPRFLPSPKNTSLLSLICLQQTKSSFLQLNKPSICADKPCLPSFPLPDNWLPLHDYLLSSNTLHSYPASLKPYQHPSHRQYRNRYHYNPFTIYHSVKPTNDRTQSPVDCAADILSLSAFREQLEKRTWMKF